METGDCDVAAQCRDHRNRWLWRHRRFTFKAMVPSKTDCVLQYVYIRSGWCSNKAEKTFGWNVQTATSIFVTSLSRWIPTHHLQNVWKLPSKSILSSSTEQISPSYFTVYNIISWNNCINKNSTAGTAIHHHHTTVFRVTVISLNSWFSLSDLYEGSRSFLQNGCVGSLPWSKSTRAWRWLLTCI